MPDSICSTNPSPVPSYQYQDAECVDPLLGGSCSATSQTRSDATQASNKAASPSNEQAAAPQGQAQELSPAAASIVARNSRGNCTAQFVHNQKQAANTTAERTAQTPLKPHPYVDYGRTADSVYATAGLSVGRDPESGVTEELATVSAQVGAQNEAQLTLLRMGMQNEQGDALGVEALTLQAGCGIHNKDGSLGVNVSASATLVGVEATLDHEGGQSTTVGLSAAASFEASIGIKDSDQDGEPELCARLALPEVALSAGVCIDAPEGGSLLWTAMMFGGGPATFVTPPVVPGASSTGRVR